MSAETIYGTIKDMLEDDYNLREIPNLSTSEEVKESHSNDGFILQPVATGETQYTSGGLASVFVWRLEIIFKNISGLERAQKFDTFNSIKQSLQQIDGFKGFIGATTFERLQNFTFLSLGIINFEYGIEGSC